MESKTQFDLNHNLELWRQSLAQSPSFQPDNLDELEVHLRDSVNTLEAKGLSTEEAFLIAVRRVGQPTELDKEFGKVNSETVWLSRWLWMAVGTFLFLWLQSLKGVVNYALLGFGKHFVFNAHVLGFLNTIATLALFVAPIVFLPRLAARSLKLRSQFITRSILHHPVISMAGLVLFSISLTVLCAVGNKLAWRGFSSQPADVIILATWSAWPKIAGIILLPMAIVYLYRRQLKTRTNPV
ncbi:permease prefix domain 1-containing protein [Pedosphaera parvula]|nr:permease prefix domain 1-containing protein [Pedosphaera parvula]